MHLIQTSECPTPLSFSFSLSPSFACWVSGTLFFSFTARVAYDLGLWCREKSKYEVCSEILTYQRKNKISDEKLAKQIELTLAETEDILYYRITHFTLDRLLTYANKLFKSEPLMLGIIKNNRERETIRKH